MMRLGSAIPHQKNCAQSGAVARRATSRLGLCRFALEPTCFQLETFRPVNCRCPGAASRMPSAPNSFDSKSHGFQFVHIFLVSWPSKTSLKSISRTSTGLAKSTRPEKVVLVCRGMIAQRASLEGLRHIFTFAKRSRRHKGSSKDSRRSATSVSQQLSDRRAQTPTPARLPGSGLGFRERVGLSRLGFINWEFGFSGGGFLKAC